MASRRRSGLLKQTTSSSTPRVLFTSSDSSCPFHSQATPRVLSKSSQRRYGLLEQPDVVLVRLLSLLILTIALFVGGHGEPQPDTSIATLACPYVHSLHYRRFLPILSWPWPTDLGCCDQFGQPCKIARSTWLAAMADGSLVPAEAGRSSSCGRSSIDASGTS
jgi:hypothetical protein